MGLRRVTKATTQEHDSKCTRLYREGVAVVILKRRQGDGRRCPRAAATRRVHRLAHFA